MSVYTISWQRDASPSSWSVMHLTADGKRTLCGVRIPGDFVTVFRLNRMGQNECRRCEAHALKLDLTEQERGYLGVGLPPR